MNPAVHESVAIVTQPRMNPGGTRKVRLLAPAQGPGEKVGKPRVRHGSTKKSRHEDARIPHETKQSEVDENGDRDRREYEGIRHSARSRPVIISL